MPYMTHSHRPNPVALATTLGVRPVRTATADAPPSYDQAMGIQPPERLPVAQISNRHSAVLSKSAIKGLQKAHQLRQRTDIDLYAARYELRTLLEQEAVASGSPPVTSFLSIGSGLFDGGASEDAAVRSNRIKELRTKVERLEAKGKSLAAEFHKTMDKLEFKLLKLEARQRPETVPLPGARA